MPWSFANWIEEDGVWRSQDGLPPPLPSEPACAEGRDLCHLREDLFVDDRLYRRVGSLDELEPGTWFYGDGRAHLVDDPTRRLVELSVVPLAIGSDAVDVLLQDLTVEKYAPLAQQAAIESVERARLDPHRRQRALEPCRRPVLRPRNPRDRRRLQP